MKTLVIFYSYTGHTKALAQKLAADKSADIVEIKDIKCPSKIKAFSIGCFAAMRGKAWPIQPIELDLKSYDSLILLSPIWAGNPPPAVHAFMQLLPEGVSVSIKMVSASGSNSCRDKLEAAVRAKGGKLNRFEDIKA